MFDSVLHHNNHGVAVAFWSTQMGMPLIETLRVEGACHSTDLSHVFSLFGCRNCIKAKEREASPEMAGMFGGGDVMGGDDSFAAAKARMQMAQQRRAQKNNLKREQVAPALLTTMNTLHAMPFRNLRTSSLHSLGVKFHGGVHVQVTGDINRIVKCRMAPCRLKTRLRRPAQGRRTVWLHSVQCSPTGASSRSLDGIRVHELFHLVFNRLSCHTECCL